MTREDPQMKIRLPDDLKTTIEKAARESGRSMNAEIVARLQQSFDRVEKTAQFVSRHELMEVLKEFAAGNSEKLEFKAVVPVHEKKMPKKAPASALDGMKFIAPMVDGLGSAGDHLFSNVMRGMAETQVKAIQTPTKQKTPRPPKKL